QTLRITRRTPTPDPSPSAFARRATADRQGGGERMLIAFLTIILLQPERARQFGRGLAQLRIVAVGRLRHLAEARRRRLAGAVRRREVGAAVARIVGWRLQSGLR